MWIKEVPTTGKIRYCEKYTDYLTGKRKEISVTYDKDTATNRREAAKVLAAKIAEKQNQKPQELTLGKMLEAYLKDQKVSVKESTYDRNQRTLNSVLKLLGADTIVNRMTALYVRQQFLASGKSGSVLNGYLRRFKSMWHWAFRFDLVDSTSLIDKLEQFPDKPHSKKIEDKYMESEELVKVLDHMKVTEWKQLTEFMALSGLRYGEAAALEKKDVDLENKVIHITKTLDNKKNTSDAKTQASFGDVIIQPELEEVIRRINFTQASNQVFYGYRTKLFMSDNKGGYIHYDAFNKYLFENTERLIGKHLTTHALRHTHASLLFEQGFTLDEVSRRLRHADSRITREIYIHVTKKLKEKDKAKLQKVKLI